MDETARWVKVDPDGLAEGQVMTVVAICGGAGFSVRSPGELGPALESALAHAAGPSLVEIHSSSKDV